LAGAGLEDGCCLAADQGGRGIAVPH
jgi:hypothetical protein